MGNTIEPIGVELPTQSGATGLLLPRNRLIEGLVSARRARVVLLEAPAGYAKTTTLRLWENAERRPFVWVGCESRHDDPSILIEAVVEALNAIRAIEEDLLLGLGAPSPDLSLVMGRLGKVVGAMEPFVLVIDDAHLLESDRAWQVLYSLIVALPPKSQIAIATRVRPRLPVGRLRARGELHEVTVPDLALTRRESRQLLTGLDPALEGRADEIHEKAEGWPAALYLAGLSLSRGGEAGTSDLTFSGGDRVVVEYFRDEFFEGVPAEQARFLYQTSILEELNGPVCDAVTGRTDSAALLDRLARENAMIVPLDRQASRFRYHHLFADMLLSELRREEPASEPELHHRAAAWLAGNGDIPAATDHAIGSGDMDLAGALIWLDIPDITGRGRIATFERWCEAIGPARIERNPALILSRAHCALVSGQADASFYWFSVAEREIGPDSPQYGDLLMLRATMGAEGPAQMIEDAGRANELLTPDNPWRVPVNLYRGIGLFLEEDDQAEELFRVASREAVNVSPIIQTLALAHLALAELERDRIEGAFTHVVRARDQVERCGLGSLGVMSLVFAVLARVVAGQGRTEEGADVLARSIRMSEGMEDFPAWYEAELLLTHCATMTRIGQFESASATLRRAEQVVSRSPGSPRLVRWLEEAREALRRQEGDPAQGLNLTRAELRTLRFLPSHHSFKAIGEQLFLSQNTIKTQANSLYRKLGVNSRAEAVMEGRRLGILENQPE